MDDAPLVRKLARFASLDPRERALLAALGGGEVRVGAQTELGARGDPSGTPRIVVEGWLYSHCTASDGRRQIVRLHYPGDITGLEHRLSGCSATGLRAATGARLRSFEVAAFDTILTDSPRLAALLFAVTLREQIDVAERIRSVGRTTARERIAFFLLDILHRLRAVDPRIRDTFVLPLSQAEIGDATSLTNVTVSKTLMELQLDKLIDRRDGAMILRDIGALAATCGYIDRGAMMDLSWLPR